MNPTSRSPLTNFKKHDSAIVYLIRRLPPKASSFKLGSVFDVTDGVSSFKWVSEITDGFYTSTTYIKFYKEDDTETKVVK